MDKKIVIEFFREKDGTRQFKVYAQGQKKFARKTTSQYQAFSMAQTLYANLRGQGTVAA